MTDLQMRSAQPTSTHPVYPGGHPLSAERAAILAADPERERLITQMLAATSEEEIAAARRAQEMWLAANPDDFGVLEAGEALSYAEEALFGDELPEGPDVAVGGERERPTIPSPRSGPSRDAQRSAESPRRL